MGIAIRLEHVDREYGRTEESALVQALRDVTLEIPAGALAILKGPSGSGKSTLLNVIGAVDRPTGGRVWLGEREITKLRESGLTLLRRQSIGFIFQFFNLIPTLTVAENIAFPLQLLGTPRDEVRTRVDEVLGEIGLGARARHFPNELSGGEMQRVAIGRAIVHRPSLILADEPTGNLDTHTGEKILDSLRSVHETYRPTIVMATHSERAASFGSRVIQIQDGTIAR